MTTTIGLTMPIYEGMPGHPFHGRTPVFLSGTLNHRMSNCRLVRGDRGAAP